MHHNSRPHSSSRGRYRGDTCCRSTHTFNKDVAMASEKVANFCENCSHDYFGAGTSFPFSAMMEWRSSKQQTLLCAVCCSCSVTAYFWCCYQLLLYRRLCTVHCSQLHDYIMLLLQIWFYCLHCTKVVKLIIRKIIKSGATMSDCKAKMHQIRFQLVSGRSS